jgi:hypothetical protein
MTGLSRAIGAAVGVVLVLGLLGAVGAAVWQSTRDDATIALAVGPQNAYKIGSVVHSGDVLTAPKKGELAVNFGDGSVLRLGSGATVALSTLDRSGGGEVIRLQQRSGSTWSQVSARRNPSHFVVELPAGARVEDLGGSLEVELGTETPAPTATVTSWTAKAVVSAGGRNQQLEPGQQTTLANGRQVGAPKPTPEAAAAARFAVFNRVLDVTRGALMSIADGTLASGAAKYTIKFLAEPGAELQVTAGWPAGPKYDLTVIDPTGNVARDVESTNSPVSLVIQKPAYGVWSYTISASPVLAADWWAAVTWRPARTVPEVKASPEPAAAATAPPSDASCAGEASARSALASPSTPMVEIDVYNRSAVPVVLYWLDYRHNREEYAFLQPGEYVQQPSYVGHVWILADGSRRCIRLLSGPGTVIVK